MKTLHVLCVCAFALALPACQTESGDPGLGSETHWLTSCASSLSCPGDAICLCGVCTAPCAADRCGEDEDAVCTPVSEACEVSVCQRACGDSDPCDAGESCQEGVCVAQGAWSCGGTQRVDALADGATLVSGPRVEASGEGCADLSDGSGVHCASSPAVVDAVVVEGEVVHRVCSPAAPPALALEGDVQASEGDLYGVSGEVVFREGVTLKAPRVSLRGESLEGSVLRGDVTLESSQARLRHLTIDGDLVVMPSAQGAALYDVHVTGSVRGKANNLTLMRVQIDGDWTWEGNKLVSVDVQAQGQVAMEPPELCLEGSAAQGSFCDQVR